MIDRSLPFWCTDSLHFSPSTRNSIRIVAPFLSPLLLLSMSSGSAAAAGTNSGVREVGGTRRPDGTLRKAVRVRDGFKSEELDAAARPYKSRGQMVGATSAKSIGARWAELSAAGKSAFYCCSGVLTPLFLCFGCCHIVLLQQMEAQSRSVVGLGDAPSAATKPNPRALKRQRRREARHAAWLAAGGVGPAPSAAGDEEGADSDDEQKEGVVQRAADRLAAAQITATPTSAASAAASVASATSVAVAAAAAADADPAKQLKALLKKLRQMEQLEQSQSEGKTLAPEQLEKLAKKSTLQRDIELLQARTGSVDV